MAFDLSTAVPVGASAPTPASEGFDLSSAIPVGSASTSAIQPAPSKAPKVLPAPAADYASGEPGDVTKLGWSDLANFVKNIGMGAVKGASDIGATIMQPVDWATDKLTGRTDPDLTVNE